MAWNDLRSRLRLSVYPAADRDVGRAPDSRSQSVFPDGSISCFLILAIILAVVAGISSILAGFALMSGGPSARKLGLLAAFLALVSGPLGIALGAYTLVVLVPANRTT